MSKAKVFRIIEGWKNFVFPDNEVEEMAKSRAEICGVCPFNVEGVFEILKDRRIEEIEGDVCKLCGCPLSAKLRSPEEVCDDGRW